MDGGYQGGFENSLVVLNPFEVPNSSEILIICRNRWLQTEHSDFEHGKGVEPGYFMITIGLRPFCLCICFGSHKVFEPSDGGNDKAGEAFENGVV